MNGFWGIHAVRYSMTGGSRSSADFMAISYVFHRGVVSAIFVFLIFNWLTGCAVNMTGDELLKRMQEGTAPLIVDVRSQGEYDRDHVPGATHIPFYAISSGLQQLGYPKTDPVVLYCEHGPRASIAGISLYLSGYDKIYTLDGHMKKWRKKFPIEIFTHDGTAQ
jgi:rhodanese-related sulfurtransferase